eukprot:1534559-Pyramimonas_sp.AAC.1
MGKKPDALFKMVIFRLAEAATNDRAKLMSAIEQGPHPKAAAEAVSVLERWGTNVQSPDFM